MPALLATEFVGEIVWLGRVADRKAALQSESLTHVDAQFAGIPGEEHRGLTRLSCSRVLSQFPRDTVIRNVRQLAIVSAEELALIADAMGLAKIDPAWLGSSMVVRGLPDFSHIPPSSRLQTQHGTTLTVDMLNRPCNLPAKVIEAFCPGGGAERGIAFKAAAKGRRGVTALVEREGPLRVGDSLTLHVPDQRPWQNIDAVLTGK